MTITFQFHADPALTTPLRSALMFLQDDSAPQAADAVVYFGSPNVGHTAEDSGDPGIDPIEISISSSGSGIASSSVRLATSSAGLDGATPGAPLVLPISLSGGAANAVAVHVRVLDGAHVDGKFSNLSLIVSSIRETS